MEQNFHDRLRTETETDPDFKECAQCGEFSPDCKVDLEGCPEYRCPPCYNTLHGEHSREEHRDDPETHCTRCKYPRESCSMMDSGICLTCFHGHQRGNVPFLMSDVQNDRWSGRLSDGSTCYVSLDEETALAVVSWNGGQWFEIPYEADNRIITFKQGTMPDALWDMLP